MLCCDMAHRTSTFAEIFNIKSKMTTTTNVSVTLTPELRLLQALIEAGVDDAASVTQLTIAGTVTEDDFEFIREMMAKTLQELDMTNTSISRITHWAFEQCSGLVSVNIPDSIIEIGRGAFYRCTGLMSVNIPDAVVKIGYAAFENCAGLTSVILPDSLKIIEEKAFCCCSGLTSVRIPNSVVKIGIDAFEDCFALRSVIISESAVEIENYAFSHCAGLTSVIIPRSVTKMGNDIFFRCSGLAEITVHPDNPVYASENGVLFTKDKTELIMYPQGRQGDYVIPDSVVIIRKSAFNFCAGLLSVTIPNSVIEIGDGTFSECTGLTSVIIPDSVVSIGSGAFRICTGLTSVSISESVREIGYMVFRGCTGLTSVTIPDSVREIHYAFWECTGLTSVTIPKLMQEIDLSSLGLCSALISIDVHPDNPVYASENGVLFNKTKTELMYCPNALQGDYVIPDTVIIIHPEAFTECAGLTSVTIPDSVIEIECSDNSSPVYNFLRGCVGVTSITVHPNNLFFASENGVLFNKDRTILLQYPQGRQGNYVIPDSVMVIGYFAFCDCIGLNSVMIPNSVVEIDGCVFEGCTGLTSLNIPVSVVTIKNWSSYRERCPAFITVHPDHPFYTSKNGKLYKKADKTTK